MKRVRLLAPKRRVVQWLCALLFVALPIVQLDGDALLRLDVPTRTLHVFGSSLRFVEFRLLLVAVLLLLFGFLLMTMVLGRVWCGWLCPQTALSDLSEWLGGRVARLVPHRAARRVLRELCHLLVALSLAALLLCYFIPAGDLFGRLRRGDISPLLRYTLLISAGITYLNLAFLRRRFCKTLCPYGRLQFFTVDRGTLTLVFDDPGGERCTGCGACRSVCPMGVDIREGTQIGCINCGRCLDACRSAMAKRGGDGLIRYRFARDGRWSGWGRWSLFGGIVLSLFIVLVAGIATRPEASVQVRRATAPTKRIGAVRVSFYTAYLENRGEKEGRYSLLLTPLPGLQSELLGPVRDIRLAPNGNRRVDFAVRLSTPPAARRALELCLVRQGRTVARTPLPLSE